MPSLARLRPGCGPVVGAKQLPPSIVAESIDRTTSMDRAGWVDAGNCFALVERDDVVEHNDTDDAVATPLSSMSSMPSIPTPAGTITVGINPNVGREKQVRPRS